MNVEKTRRVLDYLRTHSRNTRILVSNSDHDHRTISDILSKLTELDRICDEIEGSLNTKYGEM